MAKVTSVEELAILLRKKEDENLEFKEARFKFDTKYYCAALANEGGGKLLLGIDDSGEIVGSKAYEQNYNRLSHRLFDSLKIRIEIEEVNHPNGRVLIFHVPSRFPAQRVKSTGAFKYPIRHGESLVEMDDETTKRILNEVDPDFSASIVDGLTIKDLDEEAMQEFRSLWSKKSERPDYLEIDFVEMLDNLDLKSEKGITYAGLILLGKEKALTQYLPDSEFIFEWRQVTEKTAYDARKVWRKAFVLIFDEIWDFLNERNLRFPLQEGFFQRDIWAFVEKPIREAVLNAVAHRDYRTNGRSIFVTASPAGITIDSPGRFLTGVTPENILEKHEWRNRRLAEALHRIGLVERSGQGMNDIFEDTIRSGKGTPIIREIDNTSVELWIPAQVKDPEFIAYLEKISNKKQFLLSLREIIALEEVRTKGIVDSLDRKEKFLKNGLIETVGRGRGTKYTLAHQYYVHAGRTGKHTKLIGLSREKNKELIFVHIQKNKKGKTAEFRDALPELSKKDIDNLLQELRRDGRIFFEGKGRAGYWKIN